MSQTPTALEQPPERTVIELLRKHRPERASGPPHRTGLPEASYRKPVRFTSLTNHNMICEQFLGMG